MKKIEMKGKNYESKKIGIIVAIVVLFIAAAIIVVWNQPSYPSKNKMITLYQKAGFEIEELTTCGEVEGVQRVIATKGDLIADFTYMKTNEDWKAVQDYYEEYYENSYIIGHRANDNNSLIYYTNDKNAWEPSNIEEIKINVNIDPMK